MQLLQFLAGKRSSPPARPNASPEQCFVGINVAYPAEQLLVQQRTLNRSFAAVKKRGKIRERNLQRFGAGSFEFLDYAQASEAARVNEP